MALRAETPARDAAAATLAATILGSSLAFVDSSILNVALPSIGRHFHAGPAGLAWLITSYLLTLSALTMLGGAVGDRFGRRRLFCLGVGIFLAASLACAAAPTLAVILVGRAIQGAGAALLTPNSLALLGAGFAGEEKGRAIGTWAGAGALASALGPVLGGWLIQALGWRAIFVLNLPVGAVAFWLAWRFVPESLAQRIPARLDWMGGLLVTLALGLVTWSLTDFGSPGRDVVLAGAACLGGVALLAAFAFVESGKGEDALVPMFFMTNRNFVGATLLTFCLYAALGGLVALLPFVLIRALDYSPVAAGAAMLPLPLTVAVGSRLMGAVAVRVGGRLPLAIGSATVAAGLALFLRLGLGGSYWGEVLPASLVVAIGIAISVAPLTTTVMTAADPDHVGTASGFNSAVARTGSLIATALLGLVFAAAGSAPALVARAHAAAAIGSAVALAGAACALALIRDAARG